MKETKKKNFNNKIKLIITNIKKIEHIIYMTLPLIIMDLITRLSASHIDFYNVFGFAPTLFSLAWIILIISTSILLKQKIGKYIYLISNIFFFIMFLVNNIYYSITNTFFDFILLESISEGSSYIIDVLKNTNILTYLLIILIMYLKIES